MRTIYLFEIKKIYILLIKALPMLLLKHFMYVKWTKKYGRTFTWISRYQSVLRTASLLKDHSIF